MLVRAILLAASVTWPAALLAQTPQSPSRPGDQNPTRRGTRPDRSPCIDVPRRRLFVAELGNDSLGVVDLVAGKTMRTISGFSEPQGVVYVPSADSVYVANGGDGSVRVLRGEDLAPVARIDLGSDADNVRIDTPRKRVLVGYGKGALAVIDPGSRSKTAELPLKAHPESFQLDESGTQVFVNVPDTMSKLWTLAPASADPSRLPE